MTVSAALRPVFFSLVSFLPLCAPLVAQTASAASAGRDADLQLVVVLTRHGVRAPMGAPELYNQYSAAPWPQWDVPPSYLTEHGYQLMKLFGAWDRTKFSGEGLLAPSGCADAAHVTILADTDQRTRETGKALADGMFPGCNLTIHSQPEGTDDRLFRPLKADVGHIDSVLAVAAISGRIGGDPNNLTEAYRPQLAALDRVLAGCGHEPAGARRTSIFAIPASLKPGAGDPPFAARGPVPTASTLAENLLLEYTEGMSDADTGWGCVDGVTVRALMQLDTASWDYGFRTPVVARMYASNLLDHIRKTMEQGVTGKPIPGALGNPGDRLVILVGHDTNIVAVAGALGIDWVLDGRVDDTPPGGALVFELWRSRSGSPQRRGPVAGDPGGGEPFVRVAFTTQTLEQMRKAEPLTPANPPAGAPIFVPGCSRQDLSCTWDGFSAAVRQAIDPAYVSGLP
jgi:4-phytase/acid phosphatase